MSRLDVVSLGDAQRPPPRNDEGLFVARGRGGVGRVPQRGVVDHGGHGGGGRRQRLRGQGLGDSWHEVTLQKKRQIFT